MSNGIYVMANSTYGSLSNDETYTPKEISNRLGKTEAAWKAFIRANVQYTEPMEGVLLVSGRLFNFAIEELSQHDTEEAKQERCRKSGAASRTRKKEQKS